MQQGQLLAGKRGLLMGVANEKSIAWDRRRRRCARGGDCLFLSDGGFGKRLKPLADSDWI